MSLLRLLTAGKSLESLKTDAGLYRVANRGFLPKFGSKENPFRATTRPEATGHGHAPTEAAKPLAKTPEIAASPAASKACGPAEAKDFPKAGARGGWLPRVATTMLHWFRRRPTLAVVPGRARPMKGPVQGELLLASVKVVRNDLSDSDLEVVAGQASAPAVKSAPAVPQAVGADRLAEPAASVPVMSNKA